MARRRQSRPTSEPCVDSRANPKRIPPLHPVNRIADEIAALVGSAGSSDDLHARLSEIQARATERAVEHVHLFLEMLIEARDEARSKARWQSARAEIERIATESIERHYEGRGLSAAATRVGVALGELDAVVGFGFADGDPGFTTEQRWFRSAMRFLPDWEIAAILWAVDGGDVKEPRSLGDAMKQLGLFPTLSKAEHDAWIKRVWKRRDKLNAKS